MEQIDTDKKIDFQKNKLNKKVFFLEKLNHSNSQKKFIQSKIENIFYLQKIILMKIQVF